MKKRGNGNGGIVDRGKGRYLRYSVRITTGYDENGKQKYKYISSHHTRKEAELALAKYLVNPYDLSSQNLTFGDIFEKAFEVYKKKNTSKSALVSYETAFKNCEKIVKMPIANIRKIHLQECLDNQTSRSSASLGNIIKVYHLTFKYALENDIVSKDYSQYVEIMNTTPTKKRTIFTEKEIKDLWIKSDNDNVKITLILLYTGFRVNELLTLNPENINLADKYIQGGLKTKAGKDRIIPIHHRIMPFIEYFLKQKYEPMFNISYNQYLKWLDKNCSHTPHETRHTFTTLLQKYNAKQLWIDKIIGHSSGNLANDLYTHIDITELRKTIELLP